MESQHNGKNTNGIMQTIMGIPYKLQNPQWERFVSINNINGII